MSHLDQTSSQLQIDLFQQMMMVNPNFQMNINATSVQIVNTINTTHSTTSPNKRQRIDSTIPSLSTSTNELSMLRQSNLDKDQEISDLREMVALLKKSCEGQRNVVLYYESVVEELEADKLKLRSQLQEKNSVFKRSSFK